MSVTWRAVDVRACGAPKNICLDKWRHSNDEASLACDPRFHSQFLGKYDNGSGGINLCQRDSIHGPPMGKAYKVSNAIHR